MPIDLQKYKSILKKYWGYEEFRLVQEKIVASIANGEDTLGLMPTGGGKSITFQVPALAMEGMCVVITPLIALMTDQVENLKKRGIKAAAIHSGLGRHEMKVMLDNAMYGAYKFLYISPERLGNEDFRTRLGHSNVSFLTIDEAHCISQWGYDFRPSYLNIARARELKPEIPILALTATATPEVVEDIQLKLAFREENVIRSDFSRNNLVYFVRQSESKMSDLIKVVHSIHGSGIVYARNRKKTREIAEQLRREGIDADYYNAGLSYEVRQQKQDNWTQGKTRVIAATNAFGMGIDKPDVRFVVHVDFPDSLEEYFQEAGRAGRDGKKSFAVLLAGSRDKATLKQRLTNSFPEIDYVKQVYNAVSNFMQVPIGGGKGIAFDFNLHDFVTAYKLQPIQAFSALKLLEQQGYIEVTDEMKNPSRIFFVINRDDLYKFQVKNSKFDGFIKLVLRSYTGLFSDYVSINEEVLAKRAGITRDAVYQYFVRLGQMNVIKYIPGKRTALLVYLEERLPDKSVYISPENYHHRKERYERRIAAMSEYGFREDKCRSVQLLNYFGQSEADECGQCDYCRNKDKHLSADEYKKIRNEIIEHVTLESLSPDELAKELKHDQGFIIKVLRDLLEEEIVVYDERGRIGVQ